MDDPNVIIFGLMNSLRTGNIVTDMAVCMLLPFIFKSLWGYLHAYYVRFTRWLRRRLNRQYRRTIQFERSSNPWSESKVAHKNRVLVTALRMYIGRQVKPSYPCGDLKLQSVKSRGDSDSAKSLVDQLEKKFHIHTVPPRNGEPVEVAPGLFFLDQERVARADNDEGKKSGPMKMTTTLTFTTHVNGGRQRVDMFVQNAYEWYVQQVEANEDHSYFMYQPLVSAASTSSDDKKDKRTEYKRYRLSNEKTFKSIFFPEREKVLGILKHFADKSGKFAIRGFPHKLGLLLHGPPGTGKTSLVKAIAAHTKRHIISVPLSRIRTNQELMDVMFDQVFPHKSGGSGGGDDDDDDDEGGSGETTKHRIDEVVFLLEDVDAASKVVHSRGEEDTPEAAKGNEGEEGEESTLTRALSTAIATAADDEDDDKSGGDDDGDKSKGDDGDSAAAESPSKKKKKSKKKDSLFEDADKLDLAGLLNVLDGVVDAPGRILVMTTNHPEKLDRALLRPGRVNMRIYMGFINCDDAMRMTSHYYPGSSDKDIGPIRAAFQRKERACKHGLKMSPAEFEQLCAESNTLEDLVKAIDAFVPKRR